MSAIDVLGQRVIDRLGLPKDAWEIAAQLEVEGMRDSDARTYGLRDLFELARAIERRFRAGAYTFFVEGEDPRPRVIPIVRFLRRYFAGIVFAVPMALQAASMLVWGYGIWGAIHLELTQGSAIALGFIASYIVAGGFAQAIVRRGLFYMYQEEETLARWTALRGFGIALRAMLALLAVILLANLVFEILPWSMALVAALYYVGLGTLWLSWSLLYLVRRMEMLVVVTVAALGAVLLAAKVFAASPIVANAVGVAMADALSFAIAWFLLARLAKKRKHEPVNPPRMAVLIFSTSRYFVYGLLFNAFLFADRVIAWTTRIGRDDFPPYAFWLSVRYELAMDLALVVAIVMGGMVEYAIERFSDKLVPHQKRVRSSEAAGFIDDQRAAHRRRSWQIVASAAAGLATAWALFFALQRIPDAQFHAAITATATLRVFAVASVAYVFFMFAVRNLLLLLTLSRVDAAVRCLGTALSVDVVTGFVFSRAIGYWAAVLGLAAGAIVLMIASNRALRRTLDRLDYFYYAAY
ncbi:MAG TPA: hypothetical protein VGR95_14670 [Thermoanaerobaculia bacterium]|jgi:hypothetical protein|nr:hypothetical protein [Thermoanaerobaculia bacterium]